MVCELWFRPPNLPFPWRPGPYLIQCNLGPQECLCQMASHSVVHECDRRHTCIHAYRRTDHSTVISMPPNNNNKYIYTRYTTPKQNFIEQNCSSRSRLKFIVDVVQRSRQRVRGSWTGGANDLSLNRDFVLNTAHVEQ